jgi:dimethylaniline monooxygenase (N-oxide forming)
MHTKRVAIIGAGQSGLACAKYALEKGLNPSVFDKSSEIGGLWASKNLAIWDGLHTNVSKYTMMFSDHPWPKNTPLFPDKQSVQNYLVSYANRFDLVKNIHLNTKIQRVNQTSDKKWEVIYENESNDTKSNQFDYLMVASGLHSEPRIPQFKDQSKFKGLLIHSSQYKLNDIRLQQKKVIILGFSLSGADLSSQLVGHAKSITNIFTRPYLVAPRLVSHRLNNGKYGIITFDHYFYRRCLNLTLESKKKTKAQIRNMWKLVLADTFPYQTGKNPIDENLFFDLEDENKELLITISDNYIDFVGQKKITPLKDVIKEFHDEGVLLESGRFVEADAVIFCTGYEFNMDYFDESLNKRLKVDCDSYYKLQLLLSKYTFNPYVENLAMIGQIDGLYFAGIKN